MLVLSRVGYATQMKPEGALLPSFKSSGYFCVFDRARSRVINSFVIGLTFAAKTPECSLDNLGVRVNKAFTIGPTFDSSEGEKSDCQSLTIRIMRSNVS